MQRQMLKSVISVSPIDLTHWTTLQCLFNFTKSCVFPWVANFLVLAAGFVRLPTLSRTYIVRRICLTENKIWVVHLRRGGSTPSCFTPNTRDLYLLFYTTVSLNFGRCPIFDSMRCDRAYEMQSCHFMRCHATCTIRATCNISTFRIIIFLTYNFIYHNFHVNTSRKHILI